MARALGNWRYPAGNADWTSELKQLGPSTRTPNCCKIRFIDVPWQLINSFLIAAHFLAHNYIGAYYRQTTVGWVIQDRDICLRLKYPSRLAEQRYDYHWRTVLLLLLVGDSDHDFLYASTRKEARGILCSKLRNRKKIDSASVFEDFIDQLLRHCGRWPEPKSVLVMDNASFHHSERITQMCADAGVKLVYLPPYSPDFNPIEEFFAELKGFIRRNWSYFEEHPDQGFDHFLEWCIDTVGARKASARGHFRHAGLTVEIERSDCLA